MDIENLLASKGKIVDREIEKILPKKYDLNFLKKLLGKPRYAYSPKTLTKALSTPSWDFLSRGGKRWRPYLFLIIYEALGKQQRDALKYTSIPELIHNGTIIIDDIEDNSEIRRGKPCLHKIFGEDIAINVGNFLYFLPMLHLKDAELPPSKARRAYEAYIEEMVQISMGQGVDIAWHRGLERRVTEDEYLQMCAFKTGTLSRLSARLAAILAGSSVKKEMAMGHFAEAIGVAFQIQDDILNLRPTEKWGKTAGDDISEGKRTLIVIHFLKKARPSERRRLLKILDSHTKNKTSVKAAIALLEKYGSLDYAKERARSIVKDSWKDVDSLLKESKAKRQLKAFADFLVERDI
ncbi:MAG: polyprenyl synthetase family protein [Candidatus Aenigmarchaeota archaeon]|nr:polyprenyl synthetase family protein [Candidatus Aenigmarchaeota archaeon]